MRYSFEDAHYTDGLYQKFRFDRRFTTRNKEISANRGHWSKGRKIKSDETWEVEVSAREQKLKPFTKPVRIKRFFKYQRTNEDADNLESTTKVILDGLVAAGVLPGDSLKWVVGFDQTEFIKSKDQGGEFHIYEVKQNI